MRVKNNSVDTRTISEEGLDKFLELLKNIRYGSITLALQDGIVVQIEKNEKIRFK
jgi:hypothetical protein